MWFAHRPAFRIRPVSPPIDGAEPRAISCPQHEEGKSSGPSGAYGLGRLLGVTICLGLSYPERGTRSPSFLLRSARAVKRFCW